MWCYRKIYNRLIFLIGLVCTGSALAVGIGTTKMSLFNWLLVIMLVIRGQQIILSNHLKLTLNSKMLTWYLFCFAMMLSVISSIVYMPSVWIINSINLTAKLEVYVLGLIILFSADSLNVLRKYFFKGLYYGCIAQLVWAAFQALFWYGIGININEIVFGNILNVGNGEVSWTGNILGGVILRLTGFSWEPANFALVALIGLILSETKKMKVLFALAIICAYSKTGLLCLLVLVAIKSVQYCVSWIDKKKISVSNNEIVATVILTFVLGILCMVFDEWIIKFINTLAEGINNLYIAIVTEESISGNIHKMYYLYLPDIFNVTDIMQVLFGYGTFSAGYPYALYNIIPYGMDGAWNPESDFVTIVVGNGILGASLYYMIVIKNIFSNNSTQYRYISTAILVCGITYLFTRGTWSLLILLFMSIETESIKE